MRIGNEHEPATNVPSSFPSPYKALLPHEVAANIRSMKKPKSMLAGDIHPSFVNHNADLIAIVACKIFNLSLRDKTWPDMWRQETQTIIPKLPSPDSFDQLRNLSCTNLLSKLLETYVLDKLKEEVQLGKN